MNKLQNQNSANSKANVLNSNKKADVQSAAKKSNALQKTSDSFKQSAQQQNLNTNNQRNGQQSRISRTNSKSSVNKDTKSIQHLSSKEINTSNLQSNNLLKQPTRERVEKANSSHNLQSQSTSAAEKDDKFDKFNDSESQMGPQKQNGGTVTYSKDISIDYKESVDTNNQNSAFKSFSFVSVVMEPNKKMTKSMKQRDKTKPLIDSDVLDKQISFQSKLVEYQKQMNIQSAVEFDELKDVMQSSNKKENARKKRTQIEQKVQRGNLGFCYLDMSLLNLCGIPSLWIEPKQLVTSGTYISVGDSKQDYEPYIKPFQKNLLKKQFKVYTLLRFHKLFENDKYFGKFLMGSHQNIIQDYYSFSTENLKESKFTVHQVRLMQRNQDIQLDSQKVSSGSTNQKSEKRLVLHMVQGSQDVIPLDVPKVHDPEPALFKLINSEAKILKQILQSQNITQTDQGEWNLLWTSITLQQKPQIYEQLHDYQKINHFMNSVELTRKDRFAENIQVMKNKFGANSFDFLPETYQLPDDTTIFHQRFNQIKNRIKRNECPDTSPGGSRIIDDNLWIYKPSQSSQGKGIYIIQDTNDLQQNNDKAVVCKYISSPLLVNQHKFDLRIYVLVTSVDPLRIYVYNEGLARFASCPYDSSKSTVKNLYQHLTNYSINKKSDSFQQNKSLDERDNGNKWSLSDLQAHFEKMGIHMQPIWERIYDAIIKSIISVEHHLLAGMKKIQNNSKQNCFELFGFDVILDSQFKPYILEVNFSPSLSADSPLDYHIKSNLLVDTLNIVGLRKNNKKRSQNKNQNMQRFRQGLNINSGQAGYLQLIQANQRAREVAKTGNIKNDITNFTTFLAGGNIDQYFLDRLSRISAKHRELVFETLDELQRNKNMNYTCIFPSAGCQQYDKFFEGGGRASNQLIHKYLFTKNELYALTKQICDYQKQCLKSKIGEDHPSLSENEEEVDKSSEERNSRSKNKKKEDLKSSKSDDSSAERKKAEEKSPEKKTEQRQNKATFNRIPPSKVQEDREAIVSNNQAPNQQLQQQDKESIESPTKIKKLVSLDSGSPTKISNCSNDLETPSRVDYSKGLKLQTEESSLTKYKTPNQQTLVKIGQQTAEKEKDDKDAFSSIYSPKSLINSEDNTTKDAQQDDYKDTEHQSNNTKPSDLQKQTSIKSKSRNESKNPTSSNAHNKSYGTISSQQQNQTKPPLPQSEKKQQPKVDEQMKEKSNEFTKTEIKGERLMTEVVQLESVKQDKLNDLKLPAPNKNPFEEAKNQIKSPQSVAQTSKLLQGVTFQNESSQLNSTDIKSDIIKQETSANSTPLETQNISPEKPVETKEKKKQKMVITGDDILIEYVSRIIRHLESLLIVFQKKCQQNIELVDEAIPQQLRYTLEKFAMHTIWSTKLNQQQKTSSISKRISLRHKEMVDRRTKILTTLLKKTNSSITQQEILEELTSQDKNREKIISRIQSQKIEKMVKQSNVENQIDIVSILVEGQYNLPAFLQVSGGKTCIQGTLSSLKMFEKILKSDKIQNMQNNFAMSMGQGGTSHQRGDQFLTETKPSRENSQLFVPNIIGNGSNTQLLNKSLITTSAQKPDNNGSLNHTLNTVLPETNQKRLLNSGSASGYTSHLNNTMIGNTNENKRTFNAIQQNQVTHIQTGASEVECHSNTEGQKTRISRQMMAVAHQKNSSTLMQAQNQYQNTQPAQNNKVHSFDKRQRSYRNDQQILNMTQNQKQQEQYFHILNGEQAQMKQAPQQQQQQPQLPQANVQSRKSNYPNIPETELNLQSHKQMTPQVFNYQNSKAYKNNGHTFSPSSQGQNPKVSTSAISIVKAGDQLMGNNNASFIEFNRSHQGEGFVRKNQSFKKSENYDSINHKMIDQTPMKLIQTENKRGSSHSHHAGGGNRTSFKNNTSSKYENSMVLHNNGHLEFSGNIIKQNHTSNNRLMSFDSQQNGSRQISTTLHPQPVISLGKHIHNQKQANSSSKQQLNHGITLPQIAQPQINIEQHKINNVNQQNSHNELKIKKQI